MSKVAKKTPVTSSPVITMEHKALIGRAKKMRKLLRDIKGYIGCDNETEISLHKRIESFLYNKK